MGNVISNMLYRPNRYPLLSPQDEEIELIYLRTKSDNLIYCHLFNKNAKTTILFSHGNAETVYTRKSWVENIFYFFYPEVNIMLYEYTGYTSVKLTPSEFMKKPTEEAIYADIEAVFFYMVKELKMDPRDIILYGQSLGSGPTVELARKYDVGGVILESAFTSVFRVGFNFRFNMPGDCFINIDKIADIRCPIFLIHGVDDEIVPLFHSCELFKKCRLKYPPLWVKDFGHNNLSDLGEYLFKKIKKFIKFCGQQYNSKGILIATE